MNPRDEEWQKELEEYEAAHRHPQYYWKMNGLGFKKLAENDSPPKSPPKPPPKSPLYTPQSYTPESPSYQSDDNEYPPEEAMKSQKCKCEEGEDDENVIDTAAKVRVCCKLWRSDCRSKRGVKRAQHVDIKVTKKAKRGDVCE